MKLDITSMSWTCFTGTVAWKIGDTGKMLVVMYSLPSEFLFYKNWLGVGIFDVKGTYYFFNDMYKKSDEEIEGDKNFKRKHFYHEEEPIIFKTHDFIVTATMGTGHHSKIKVFSSSNFL